MIMADIVIVGSGIIGLTIARELNNRFSDLKITLLEKENNLAEHASGRNSGVIHAGFYYTPDSLKARLSVEGNKLMTEYCLGRNIKINRCGKVIVAKDEQELGALYELKERGDSNGVILNVIDEHELEAIEPNAKTFNKALYSPTTSTVNPVEVVEQLGNELKTRKNVKLLFGEEFIRKGTASIIETKNQKIGFKYFVNTAGLYADKIAHQFNIGQKYVLIPFKGLYLEYKDNTLITKHIYPVPNLHNPFLGVHFTKTVNGNVKVGPTAIPAFWRENYNGISNFRLNELIEILSVEVKLLYSNSCNFRKIALEEIKKYYRKYLIKQASKLVKKIEAVQFGVFLKPGIRAQLLDIERMELVKDFVVVQGYNSTHVLNAVSPAFTCAFSFSKFVTNEIEKNFDVL